MEEQLNLSKFKCLGCGACCRQDGYVRLKNEEVDQIARFLELDVYDFIQKYTVLTKDRQCLALVDKPNGECFFLTPHGCKINPVKPGQCKSFPFQWKFREFKSICAWASRENEKLQKQIP